MHGNRDIWLETVGALIAAAVLPFYMGFLHLTVAELVLYSAAAGMMLATGEQLRFPSAGGGLRDFFDDLVLWSLFVLGVGALCYLAAILLV